ncbi:MAG TPA: hypothetical protein PKW92_10345, partial [Smithella sp.]|nr:hypothetical protein [Smithella sp.]
RRLYDCAEFSARITNEKRSGCFSERKENGLESAEKMKNHFSSAIINNTELMLPQHMLSSILLLMLKKFVGEYQICDGLTKFKAYLAILKK